MVPFSLADLRETDTAHVDTWPVPTPLTFTMLPLAFGGGRARSSLARQHRKGPLQGHRQGFPADAKVIATVKTEIDPLAQARIGG